MVFLGDYHTHTKYSDGRITVRENLEAAYRKGLKEIAITDHGFNNTWSLTHLKFYVQKKEIERYRDDYPNMKIYQGIEANLIAADGTIDLTDRELADKDVIVLGWHMFVKTRRFSDWVKIMFNSALSLAKGVSSADRRMNTAIFVAAVKKYPVDIIAHINNVFCVDGLELAKVCSDYGTYIELNCKHLNTLGHELFDTMLNKTDVKFIADSDGHSAEAIGNFHAVKEFLSQHSYNPNRIVNQNGLPVFPRRSERTPEKIFRKGFKGGY